MCKIRYLHSLCPAHDMCRNEIREESGLWWCSLFLVGSGPVVKPGPLELGCIVIDVECGGKDRSNETADRANQGRASRSEHGDELPAGLGVWCARPAKWGFNVNHRP